MNKRDRNFRLSKSTKRMMAGKFCVNPNEFKKTMIEAQIFASIPIKHEKKNKNAPKEE
jgi:hypothetical protein